MASEVAPWSPPPSAYEHDGDPGGNALSGDSLNPQSMPQEYRMVGKHGQVLSQTPEADPFCPTMPPVASADDPNIGSGAGINPGPYAKG